MSAREPEIPEDVMREAELLLRELQPSGTQRYTSFVAPVEIIARAFMAREEKLRDYVVAHLTLASEAFRHASTGCHNQRQRAEAAEAERDRLREALVELGHGTETATLGCPEWGYDTGRRCPGCAALRGEKEGGG